MALFNNEIIQSAHLPFCVDNNDNRIMVCFKSLSSTMTNG